MALFQTLRMVVELYAMQGRQMHLSTLHDPNL
jgi:hypothetical protein